MSISTAPQTTAGETVREKMIKVLTPGQKAEFSLSQAQQAGVFDEDALSEKDVEESEEGLVDGCVPMTNKAGE